MECIRTGDANRIAAKLDGPAGSSVHHCKSMVSPGLCLSSLFCAVCLHVPRLGGEQRWPVKAVLGGLVEG